MYSFSVLMAVIESQNIWFTSFSYSSKHSVTPRDQDEPMNPRRGIKSRYIWQIFPIKLTVCVCAGGAVEHAQCLHHTAHMKHTVSGRKFARLCASVVYVWGADCASTASCRREQFSQLLKGCTKLSRPPTHVPYPLPLLYFTAPRRDSLSRPRYFRRGRETCSGAPPDWLRRLSRGIS